MVAGVGVIAILLILASSVIGGAQYFTKRNELESVARFIASYAGTFLPDPDQVCRQALVAKAISEVDLAKTGAPNRFGANANSLLMTLGFEYIDTLGESQVYEFSGSSCESLSEDAPAPLIPLKSLTVRLSAASSADPFGVSNWAGWLLSSVPLAVEARTRLMPTDVVIILENSSSVLSPRETGDDMDPTIFADEFGTTDYTFPIGKTSADIAELDKPRAYARQCFGEIPYNLKRAAVLLYDLLSSSGTYRVAVLPTHQSIAGSGVFEFEFQNASGDEIIPTAESVEAPRGIELAADEYGTRCAALVDDGSGGECAESQFPTPAHPFAAFLPAEAQRSCLRSLLDNGGGNPLRFALDTLIFPRERIWMENSGFVTEAGELDSASIYTPISRAIFRAHDYLIDAPERGDSIPVTRRVILVLSDGSPLVEEDRVLGGSQNIGVGLTDYSRPGIAVSPTPYADFCKSGSSPKDIFRDTNADGTFPADLNSGVKIGILQYGSRGTYPNSPEDRWQRLLTLSGHTTGEIAAYRAKCNGDRWSTYRGFFWQGIDSLSKSRYVGNIAPAVVRSLTVPEVY